MFEELKKEVQSKMLKSIESLRHDLAKLRTGRAHPSILEGLTVEYYGNPTPLNQVASITVSDPRTLSITPFDKTMVAAIDKAIRSSEMGLNPATAGQVIRVPLPPLTEERRKVLVKQLKSSAEDARVSIRNVRRDANNQIKAMLKDKEITEDDERREQDNIQKLTDSNISEIEKIVQEKETDLMHV